MIRKTRQREAIKAVFSKDRRALSVAEIQAEVAHIFPSIGIATVYRTIKSLLEAKEITTVEIGGEASRYELASLSHHHHFKCDACDKVYDVEGCLPKMSDLLPKGFRLKSHEITLFGTCAKCA